MHNIVMRLKSGREVKFSCETYRVESYKLNGSLTNFEYTGGVGECPIYFHVHDIEAILEINADEDGEV